MGLDQFLNVTYNHVSSNNMSAYLDAVGIQEPLKGKLLGLESSITLTKTGGTYSCKYTANAIQERVISFVPGEEYEDAGLMEGRTRTCVSTVEGCKIITQILNEPKGVITSEFGPDKVVVTLEAGGVQAEDIFKKA